MKDASAPGHSDSAQGSAQDLSHHPSLRDFVNVVLVMPWLLKTPSTFGVTWRGGRATRG